MLVLGRVRRQTAAVSSYLWLLLLLALTHNARASVGDRSIAYRTCVQSCLADNTGGCKLPLHLRWSRWTCEDDCSYKCMHSIVDIVQDDSLTQSAKAAALPGLPTDRVVQFHGKWPFYRLFGIQEPLSVLFSLGNLYMHLRYGLRFLARLPKDALPRPLLTAYNLVPLAGINLWVWSSVFHTRDKPWTEKLDYFSAALSMMCNLYLATIRLVPGMIPSDNTSNASTSRRYRLFSAFTLSTIFICHVSYLTFWRFDYGYNMAFNVGIGLAHNCMWAAWSAYHGLFAQYFHSRHVDQGGLSNGRAISSSPTVPISADSFNDGHRRPPHWWRPVAVLTLLSSLMALELFDFPAIWRILDAHALWHASTIPVIKLWYDVLLEDGRWLAASRVLGTFQSNKRRI